MLLLHAARALANRAVQLAFARRCSGLWARLVAERPTLSGGNLLSEKLIEPVAQRHAGARGAVLGERACPGVDVLGARVSGCGQPTHPPIGWGTLGTVGYLPVNHVERRLAGTHWKASITRLVRRFNWAFECRPWVSGPATIAHRPARRAGQAQQRLSANPTAV